MVRHHWETLSMETVAGTVVIGLVTSWAATWTYRVWALRQKRRRKQAHCKKVFQALQEKVDEESMSSERRSEILSWTLDELILKLQTGEVTAVEALTAYQHKALDAHKRTNCLTEPILEANAQAVKCDQSTGEKGALHGVPISIKDNYGLKGYDSTAGCSTFLEQPFSEDCVLVKVLKKQGAIPFVKTNIPTTLVSYETTNTIFGSTVNPHNLERGAGGSSGGEAALLASGGSVLGMGSDIGGSIRIPAALCGMYGFKPTAGRLSMQGLFSINPYQNLVVACPGPLARDVDSLVTTMRALLVPQLFELDRRVPPMPFNEEVFKSKHSLKIGYFTQDDFFCAVPACERAVHMATEALAKMGHELVPVTMPVSTWTMASHWGMSLYGDEGKHVYPVLKYDSLDSSVSLTYPFLAMGRFLTRLIATLLNPFMPRIALQLRALYGCRSVSDYWEVAKNIQEMKQKIALQWKTEGLDALICPGFGSPALRLHSASKAPGAGSYTIVFNVLDMPAGAVPVTRVNEQDVENMKSYPSRDVWDWTIIEEMKGSEGLPVGVQVVTSPWQEELCLRVMKELETALKL